MRRTIVIEEKVSDYISSLYGSYKWQIGLIIGQLSAQRDYVVHFARTPEQSDSPDACASLDDVDNSWVVEHARQVSRMLTGGLDIIGIFAFGPSDALSKSQGKLRQILYSIHKAVYHRPASYFDANETCNHNRIVLQICSQTKKVTFRTIDVSDPKSTPNPADVKYQMFVSKWLKLETTLSLHHLHLTVPKKSEKSGLQSQMMGSFYSLLHNIPNALCTVNGEILPEERLLVPGEKQGKSSYSSLKTSQPFDIGIYTEQPKGKSDFEETEIVSEFLISGTVCCRAYVNPKATVQEALHAIKYDAVRSLLSRCEVLCDDVLDNQENNSNEKFSSTWTYPKRVFTQLGAGPICVCDFMFKDETLQECRERVSELLNVQPAEEDFESEEVFPDFEMVNSLVEEMEAENKQTETKPPPKEDPPVQDRIGKGVVGAVVGVLMAIAAAGITFLWGEQFGTGTT